MPSSETALLIPVENQVRELDAKILLAAVAAERGFPVYLGSRAYLHFAVAELPLGVYLAKSMRASSLRLFSILRQLGHRIVAWDEEALVRMPDAAYYQRRLSPRAIAQLDHLFAWGPDNARALQDYPGRQAVPIHVTGNPRTDFLRPPLLDYYRAETERLRARYGAFVLIDTNFSKFNPFVPALDEFLVLLDKPATTGVDGYLRGWAKHRNELFGHFRAMLPALATALPLLKFVVRPHPSENPAPWRSIAEGRKNIVVHHEGAIIPWLMAAQAVIANGCTTLVEATVLRTPAISFQPILSEAYDEELPHKVSQPAQNVDDLVKLLTTLGSSGVFQSEVRRACLGGHITGLDGTLAAERMVSVLAEAGYATRPPQQPPATSRNLGRARTWLRSTEKRLNMRRADHRNAQHYHDHRFPETTAREIADRIARLGRLLGRFERVTVNQHSRHIFRIAQQPGAEFSSSAAASQDH